MSHTSPDCISAHVHFKKLSDGWGVYPWTPQEACGLRSFGTSPPNDKSYIEPWSQLPYYKVNPIMKMSNLPSLVLFHCVVTRLCQAFRGCPYSIELSLMAFPKSILNLNFSAWLQSNKITPNLVKSTLIELKFAHKVLTSYWPPHSNPLWTLSVLLTYTCNHSDSYFYFA